MSKKVSWVKRVKMNQIVYEDQIKQHCIRQRLARLEEQNLPENVEKRKIANKNHQKAMQEYYDSIEDLNNACKDIYNELVAVFSQVTTADEIQSLVEQNSESLNELKLASIKLLEQRHHRSALYTFNYYDNLFVELGNKVMPEFALYMDADKLKTPNIPFFKLDRKGLKAMEQKIIRENPELLEDYEFFDRYGYYLPSSIGKITNKEKMSDTTSAEEKLRSNLKRFPENYKKMDQELKLELVRTGKFSNLLSINKQLIKYMGVKEIKWVAKDSPDTVGAALYFYPEQLERIADKYPDFFQDPALSIRKIFLTGKQVTINKQLVRLTRDMYADAFKDYYDLFVELGIYFRLPKDLAKKVDPTVMTEDEKVQMLEDLKKNASVNI